MIGADEQDADGIDGPSNTGAIGSTLAAVAYSMTGVFDFVSGLFTRPFWVGVPVNMRIESVTLIDALGRTIELKVNATYDVSANTLMTLWFLSTITVSGGS